MPDEPIDIAKARALKDLASIRGLRKYDPFNDYFMREPHEQIAKLTEEITAYPRKLTIEQLDGKLGELATWKRIARKLDLDENANRPTAGIED